MHGLASNIVELSTAAAVDKAVVLSTASIVLWRLHCEPNKTQYLIPVGAIGDAVNVLFLFHMGWDCVLAKTDVFTWGQSGSAHGWGVTRSSRHRQVVIHVFYLGEHRDGVSL